jgi:tRNA dimethylallyltransferase
LYIDSALYNYDYADEGIVASARESLALEAKEQGTTVLWERLRQADPGSAEKLHPNDIKRIIRALEYFDMHGKPISQNRSAFELPKQMFDTVLVGLDLPRELLYERIDSRVDDMMEAGFLDEVRTLMSRGLRLESQAGQAIGYKQLMRHLQQEMGLDEAVKSIKQESRRYAKRQLTWFRRNKSIMWLDARQVAESDIADVLTAIRIGA